MSIKTPWILLTLPFVIAGVIFILRRGARPALRFPSTTGLGTLPVTWKIRLRRVPSILRLIVIILFLIALAGPRRVLEQTFIQSEGVDIVLAVDISGSMAAEDFMIGQQRVNRLEVVKNVVDEFIDQRQADRMGLVAFSGVAYTVSPMTTDHAWLKTNLKRLRLGLIKDGTAIGSAITAALTRLVKSEAKSRLIILLTDGMNNAGKITPQEAARAAQAMGVKIYTIGAGSEGMVPFPVTDFWGRTVYQRIQIDIDEDVLREIADITDGYYFRATDTASLRDIYREIDQLEKSQIKEWGYKEYKELFVYFLLAALIVLILELILSNTLWLNIP